MPMTPSARLRVPQVTQNARMARSRCVSVVWRSGSSGCNWRNAASAPRAETPLCYQPQAGTRGVVLALHACHDLTGGGDVFDLAHALTGAPDVLPCLGLRTAAGEVHLALVR